MVGKGGRGLVRGVSNLQGRSYRGEFSFPNWELARLVNWNSIRKGWPGWRSLLEGKQLKNDLNLVSCRKSNIEHWYLTKRHKNCEWCPASGLNDFLDSYIFSFFFCCRAGDPYWQSRYWQLFWQLLKFKPLLSWPEIVCSYNYEYVCCLHPPPGSAMWVLRGKSKLQPPTRTPFSPHDVRPERFHPHTHCPL